MVVANQPTFGHWLGVHVVLDCVDLPRLRLNLATPDNMIVVMESGTTELTLVQFG